MRSAIAVTGASGGVGSRVIRHLLARADPPPIVALARRPHAVPGSANLAVRYADYDDPSSLGDALRDVCTLVFISSDGVAESMRRHHDHVITAAIEANVEHIVYTSVTDVSPESSFYYGAVHRDTEALLAQSGLSHCLARTSIFADFFVSTWIAPALDEGTLALPAGAGRMSLLSRDDAASALGVAAVSRREGIIELTGPAALTAGEISQIVEGVTGRRLHYLALDEAAYRQRLADDQAPDWLIDAFTSMFASVREGRFEVVSADVPSLTGEPQQPFAEFIRSALLLPASNIPGKGGIVKRFFTGFVDRRRTKASARRRRALQRAEAEKKLRETQEGSIWKSGKGGAHHDR